MIHIPLLIVFMIVIAAATVIVVNFYRYRIHVHVIETYQWQSIYNALPAVLYSTHNGRHVSELLGEHLALGNATEDEDVKNVQSVLKSKFDLVFGSDNCYKFYVDDFSVKSDAWESERCVNYKETLLTSVRISLPFSESPVKQVFLAQKVFAE